MDKKTDLDTQDSLGGEQKASNLNVIQIDSDASVTDILEKMLAAANEGRLRTVFVVGELFGGDGLITGESNNWTTHSLVGALHFSAHYVMEER